ncbi:hypothetical protein [Arcobacter sp. F2176]|uniref:hypothetical protein n=1 Tax=Arcobacter sp. F2176 TaxID=2044511 RepID=UPI00100BC901|nr:hypothetical protein [Arcobacter sp. F2176]RXJ80336.1 hypothetical protein CRU95_11680 [Arcobacter sp. F2176]
MRMIKILFFSILVAFILSGCLSRQLNVSYQDKNNKEFEKYSNKVEQSLKECFEPKDDSIFSAKRYIVREDYYNPRYVKLKLFYLNVDYLNIIYIFKEKNGNKIISRDINMILFPTFESFLKNGMECEKNEK